MGAAAQTGYSQPKLSLYQNRGSSHHKGIIMIYTNREMETPLTDAKASPRFGMAYNAYFVEKSFAKQLEKDCRTLMLRLYGTDPDTMSPECREVWERWKPEIDKMVKNAMRGGV